MSRGWRLPGIVLVAAVAAAGVVGGVHQAAAGATLAGYVNVVAHQDDDVLFLNPDLAAPLRAGHPTVTVFLTAGEADGGRNAAGAVVMSQPDFAESRANGARAAYAAMMGVANAWDRRNVVRADGADYEQDTLLAAPQVKLIFLNIKDGGDPSYEASLTKLDNGTEADVETFVPNNPIVTPTPQVYTKQSLIQTLRDIFGQFQPTVVRTQAPTSMPTRPTTSTILPPPASPVRRSAPITGRTATVVSYWNIIVTTRPPTCRTTSASPSARTSGRSS